MRSQRPRFASVPTAAIKYSAICLGLILSALVLGPSVVAQMQLVPRITTIAGNGTGGYSGDGGAATAAQLHQTEGLATDSAGNLYIADWTNNVVRKVATATGVITTVAGNGTSGFTGDGGLATSAELNGPTGIAVDNAGDIYIADQSNNRVREVIAATGVIMTVAGNGAQGFSGDGGAATSAAMYSPTDLALDGAGSLYISDNANNRIRKVVISTGVITTVAGNGTAGFAGDGAAATSAALNQPAGLAFDTSGNLYIADVTNNRIRKILIATGVITTYAGNGIAGFAGDAGAATSAELNTPARVMLDSAGNLFIADQANNRIRKVAAGTITTVAGDSTAGYSGDGGPATSAQFNAPLGIAVDNAGTLYVSDFHNNVIRKLTIADNIFPSTVLGSSSTVQSLYLQTTATEPIISITVPQSLGGKQEYTIGTITGCTVDGTTLNPAGTVCELPITFTPAYPGRRRVPLQVVISTAPPTPIGINFGLKGVGVGPLVSFTPGIISTFAGTGTTGYSGDGGPATSAQISQDAHSVVDSFGSLYFRDGSYIRKVDGTAGTISTVLTANNLTAFAMDAAGNIYTGGISIVSKRDAATGVTSVFAGTGTQGHTGDGGPATSARIYSATAMAFDSLGNAYIVEGGHLDVRKVAAGSGIISTYAGTGGPGNGGDGGPATSATFTNPTELAFDSKDNLYLVDQAPGAGVVRKIDAQTGIITRVAGNGTSGYSGDGGPATSAQLNAPQQIFLDAADNLYIADYNNQRIRRVSAATGIITTIAGNGTKGSTGDGGLATAAQITNVEGLAFDGVSSFYIGGFGDYRIRKVDVSKTQLSYPTVTVAGTSDATDDPQAAIVSNIGNGDLSFLSPSTGNNPSISTGFVYDASSTCPQLSPSTSPQTLSAAADCTLAINFMPVNVGTISGSAVLTDNSLNLAGATQAIQLSGTASDGTTSTTVTSSANPPHYGQAVTFTATVAAPNATPTGTVQFSVDGVNVGTPVSLSGGVATYTTSSLTLGSHTVAATYIPDTNVFKASNGSITQIVTGAITRTVITGTPSPALYGQMVTLSATVMPTTGTLVPTGTVQFYIDNVAVGGPVSLTSGTATFTTSTLTVATHPIKATYVSDSSNFLGSTSAPFPPTNVKVNAATTTTTVVGAPNPSATGQTILFTAKIAATAGSGVPTGTVLIAIDGTNVGGPLTLTNGQATYSTSALAPGTHPVTATYTPDTSNYIASNGSSSQVVTTVSTSTTTLSAAPTSVMYGNPAVLTAVIAPNYGTGTVSFYEGTTLLGTASLDNTGTAVLPLSTLNAGVHNLTAKYNGDPVVPASVSNTAQLTVTQRTAPGGGPAITITVNDASRTTTQSNPPYTYSAAGQLVNGDTYATAIIGTPSYATSGGSIAGTYSIAVTGLSSANYSIAFVPGTLTVTTAASTTALTVGPTSPMYGDPVTITANVPAGATGTVSFYDGSVLIGTGSVTNGVATVITGSLPAGTHTITADYNGDGTYASSQSTPVTETVAKLSGPNGTAALTVTVQNESREYGTADPQFNYIVTGTLVNGDSYASAVAGTPAYSSTDTSSSSAGSTFPINVSGLSSSNYQVALVAGTLTVVAAPTTTTLTTSNAGAQYGDAVTLTATVAPSDARGTVLFMQGSTILGTGIVTNGVATLTISSLSAGGYTITSSYQGDTNYGSSTSSPVTVTISPRTAPGGGAALTITVGDASRRAGRETLRSAIPLRALW